MGEAFLYGNGGTHLNFKVVGGTTEPTNPKENVIWVNTNQKITAWAFAADEPVNPVDGMVWFIIGTPSIAEFNALKKNCIQVYPISAKQYSGENWNVVDIYVCKSNKWVSSETYLYYNGNENALLTGGWVVVPDDLGILNKGSTTFHIHHETPNNIPNSSGRICTAKPIDLTGYKQIEIHLDYQGYNGSSQTYYNGNVYIQVVTEDRSTMALSKLVLEKAMSSKDEDWVGDVTGVLDISGLGKGKYYIYIGPYKTDYRITNDVWIDRIQLK